MRCRIMTALVLTVLTGFLVSGCGTTEVARKRPAAEDEMSILRKQLDEKDAEIAGLMAAQQKVAQQADQKSKELMDLERAQKDLEGKLKTEIAGYKAKLEMTERGLVITFLSEVFFDSGKDVIKANGEDSINKVAQVLNSRVSDSAVAVEGHTDNVPIKYSGWKSNWELSTARALAVLHELIDKGTVKPQRLSAVGYGEYKPVASNDTPEGKQKNRRVEIVILPAKVSKVPLE
jgi:chemotaxis protein MotB